MGAAEGLPRGKSFGCVKITSVRGSGCEGLRSLKPSFRNEVLLNGAEMSVSGVGSES